MRDQVIKLNVLITIDLKSPNSVNQLMITQSVIYWISNNRRVTEKGTKLIATSELRIDYLE